MKRTFLLFILLITSIIIVSAQTQFENASFEQWEEIGFGPNILEPVEWSSIKSSDVPSLNEFAPKVVDRSTDAHTGNYSVYLYTVKVLQGLNATGTLCNGRYHDDYNTDSAYSYTDPEDSKWHTVNTHRPDSLVGWYKANPKPGDYPTVRVVLHTGYARVSENSDTTNYVGGAKLNLPSQQVTEWTRFSVPINYYKDINPEFAIVILTSSIGVQALEGSEAWFDDIEFKYNDGTGFGETNENSVYVTGSNGDIVVNFNTTKLHDATLDVFDIQGRNLYSDKIQAQGETRLNLNLNTGIYVVRINNGNKLISKKIVIQ
jgi:hypothetical protein